MKVLIACEESQAVCKAFRAKGHQAYSCDIQECSGGHPEWHIIADALQIIRGGLFNTQNGDLHEVWDWETVIVFPPCSDLAVSGSRSFAIKKADGRQQKSINFFLEFTKTDCKRVAIENPVGIMSTNYRKPDQIIHPYYFGDPEIKKTCLWLTGLPKLTATNVVEPEYVLYKSKKSKSGYSKYGKITGSNPSTNNPKNAKLRSKTYPGIAQAMADQWG